MSGVSPGGVADGAGLFQGLMVAGVDGYRYSAERLREAVSRTPETGQIELLVLDDETYATYRLEYDGGHRYLHAVNEREDIDILAQIAAPRRPGADEESAESD